MDKSKDVGGMETPAGFNGSNGPGEALSLPVKKYASTKLATEGGSGPSMEGPCSDKGGYGK